MSIKVGLVGLPNVGKSTLFNALTKSSVPAENFPFCTIDPNVAVSAVPDSRLDHMAKIFGSKKLIPATVEFVDIAGLVKGASSGQGLGNKFLSHIMEVDLIVHVLRCFSDPDVTHVSHEAGRVNPLQDFQTIMAELVLKDLESVQKRLAKVSTLLKRAQGEQKRLMEAELEFCEKALVAIDQFDYKKIIEISEQAKKNGVIPQLLSAKNFLVAANFDEDLLMEEKYKTSKNYLDLIAEFGEARTIPISAKLEGDLEQMTAEDAVEMRASLNLAQTGLEVLIRKAYSALDLISFFTCGPQEAHAWPIKKGITIQKAAGEIHTDLERGFICAVVYNYSSLAECGSEEKVKSAGKIRTEGRDYIVVDGDIVLIRFNV